MNTIQSHNNERYNVATHLLGSVVLGLILILTWLVYRPGLAGQFLFDDFANLPALGNYGPVNNTATFLRYITSGFADPTGRPLALLSFLIDANNWPADPYPFKRTNVLLHLLNGTLLTWLLLRLGRIFDYPERQVLFAALLGAALWILHPLLVSTTLYVVQREAMLPGTFILMGLLGYVASREAAASGRLLGIITAAFFITFATLLAVLSKANGVLLPLFALLIEWLILSPRLPVTSPRTAPAFITMRAVFLILPSLAVFIYLGNAAINGFIHGTPLYRPWTLGERLFTEMRILVDYLNLYFLPRPYSAGLFNDTIHISTSLLTPISTLFCLLLLITLLIIAIIFRQKQPAIALAIFFFFAGHLIESTVVPLELYFEHRNYIPAMLLFWPIALWLCGNGILRKVRWTLVVLLPLGLALLTFLGSSLWGNAVDQALLWAVKNPASPRAQTYATQAALASHRYAFATQRIEQALSKHPDNDQLVLNLVGTKCQAGTLTPQDLERAVETLRTMRVVRREVYQWFEYAIQNVDTGVCKGVDLPVLNYLLHNLYENSHVKNARGYKQDVLNLQAQVALAEGNMLRALELFNAAFDASPRPDSPLIQAAMLASSSHLRLAKQHLDYCQPRWESLPPSLELNMQSLHTWLLWKQGYWANETAHLRQQIEADIAAESHSNFR